MIVNRPHSHTKRRKPVGPHVAERECHRCHQPFLSEGNWNRRCRRCEEAVSRGDEYMPRVCKAHTSCGWLPSTSEDLR